MQRHELVRIVEAAEPRGEDPDKEPTLGAVAAHLQQQGDSGGV